MVEVAAEEEVVVVQALEEMAGLPAVAFSRLPVLRHLVSGVQDHDDDDGVVCQAAGQDIQLLGGVPLELQGEGLKGAQVEVSAQHSPCHPQSPVWEGDQNCSSTGSMPVWERVKLLAPPPHERGSRMHGDPVEEHTCFLVGIELFSLKNEL